jgi:hypothetical protein
MKRKGKYGSVEKFIKPSNNLFRLYVEYCNGVDSNAVRNKCHFIVGSAPSEGLCTG